MIIILNLMDIDYSEGSSDEGNLLASFVNTEKPSVEETAARPNQQVLKKPI